MADAKQLDVTINGKSNSGQRSTLFDEPATFVETNGDKLEPLDMADDTDREAFGSLTVLGSLAQLRVDLSSGSIDAFDIGQVIAVEVPVIFFFFLYTFAFSIA